MGENSLLAGAAFCRLASKHPNFTEATCFERHVKRLAGDYFILQTAHDKMEKNYPWCCLMDISSYTR